MKGWACARVDVFCKAWGVRDAVATPTESNPYHADLVKANWLIIRNTDSGRDKREKAQQLAHRLADYFNTQRSQDMSQFVPFPEGDAGSHEVGPA